MVKHGLTMVIEQCFTMVYDKAWLHDMTMDLLHNHISSMTVQNLTSHLIKLINFYYLKLNLKPNDIHAIIMYILSLGIP